MKAVAYYKSMFSMSNTSCCFKITNRISSLRQPSLSITFKNQSITRYLKKSLKISYFPFGVSSTSTFQPQAGSILIGDEDVLSFLSQLLP